MRIGELLVAQGSVTEEDVQRASERQMREGGRLGENLVAIGALTEEELDEFLTSAPPEPKTLADTGISEGTITALVLKMMLLRKLETPAQLCKALKLPYSVLETVLEELKSNNLAEILGSTGSGIGGQFRYSLTSAGREMAREAHDFNKYVGPAPVSLEAFCRRINLQQITNETVNRERIDEAFSDLIVPEDLLAELGPAINSGRSMLLFGSPGNGKSSLAERMGAMFRKAVYIPHCVEVDGEIIKVYDPSLHVEAVPGKKAEDSILIERSIERENLDLRWVPIRRPVVISGGELTLEMLDLQFNAISGFYEAPLHVKALNGIMMIDDFGRQLVPPDHLLNRWIVPLEKRIDYLKLHTGKSFEIPFDALVVFSTNLTPSDLMDPAFLRRIPYKVEIKNPSLEDYCRVFQMVADKVGIDLTQEIVQQVLGFLNEIGKNPANYQPKFLCDQIVASCRYEGIPLQADPERVARALKNLDARSTEESQPTLARVGGGSKVDRSQANGLAH
jgi:hypothetical protein